MGRGDGRELADATIFIPPGARMLSRTYLAEFQDAAGLYTRQMLMQTVQAALEVPLSDAVDVDSQAALVADAVLPEGAALAALSHEPSFASCEDEQAASTQARSLAHSIASTVLFSRAREQLDQELPIGERLI